jgi:2-polyprenyl-3-methyl-5-hydroxy-6-metoxy-1,4-benzoquinol methylase
MRPTQAHDVADELFATRFELDALASSLIDGTSERWVDGFVPLSTAIAHRRRYAFAATRAPGRRVLDLSCGAGCGSYALATAGAAEVVGVDLDPDAVRYARLRYHHDRCSFHRADAESWTPEQPFDLVVSFETIEHLQRPAEMLATLKRSLAPDGEALISTPVALTDVERPSNPYHIHEWTVAAFEALLAEAGFAVRQTWYQGVRPFPGVAARISRGIGRVLGGGSTLESRLTGDGLHESLAPYRRLRLRPKFQMHLIAHRD